MWGLFPLYFHLLRGSAALDVVAHRVAWSFLFSGGLLLVFRRGRRLRPPDGPTLRLYLAAAALVSTNWLLYVWGVSHERVVECSLGYFVNPLVTVALGAGILGEPLRPARRIALAVGGAAVAWLSWASGSPPWLALALALSFGLYGLAKKRAPLPALEGLWLETALLLPAALVWLGVSGLRGTEPFASGTPDTRILLALAGPITTVPLLLFAAAARRAKLSTLGFVQYLTPSIQLVLGTALLGESLDRPRLAGFALVWVAIAIVAVDGLRGRRASGPG